MYICVVCSVGGLSQERSDTVFSLVSFVQWHCKKPVYILCATCTSVRRQIPFSGLCVQ